MRSADVFPVVASLPPKINWLIFGGREATTGNTSPLRRLRGLRLFEREGKKENREITSLRAPFMYWGALIPLKFVRKRESFMELVLQPRCYRSRRQGALMRSLN